MIVSDATIIDVRTSGEFNEGHIKDAVNFDVQRLLRGELPNVSVNSQILLYCRSGTRAGTAQQIMQSNGFSNVINSGGLQNMLDDGYELGN